jgi:hypothetical protein
MPILPRSVPAARLAQLVAVLSAAGITVGDLLPGKRVTHAVTFAGVAWRMTYLGPMGWGLAGPGVEHGIGVNPEDAADHIVSHSIPLPALPKAPRSPDGVPKTYLGITVPALVRAAWAEPLADGWRLGIRSARAAR